MSSEKDQDLIEKLQKTIDAWSAEVSDAHDVLTSQIGDAKSQLNTLIGELGSRDSSPSEKNALPGRSAANSTHKVPDERLQALTLELEEARSELANLRASHEEQMHEMKARIYENRSDTAELEIARIQLEKLNLQSRESDGIEGEAMTQELKDRTAELSAAKLEIDSLTSAVRSIRSESETHLAAIVKYEAEATADMNTVEAFIDSQSSEIENLKAQLLTRRRQEEQFAETEEALRSELENLSSTSTGHQETVANLQSEIEQAAASAQEQQETIASFQNELRALKDEYDQLCSSEQAFRTEVDSLRGDLDAARQIEVELIEQYESVSGLQSEFDELKDEYDELCGSEQAAQAEADSIRGHLDTARQSETEIKEQLTSMMLDFERQAEALSESIRELEAHWDLAKDADETEKRLAEQINRLEMELTEETNAALQVRDDLQLSQDRLEEATKEHARELEAMHAQKQKAIYGVLKTLGEHGLSQPDTDLAIELTSKQTRIEELALSNESLSDRVQELEARLVALDALSSSGDGQDPMPAELEPLHAELKAFEENLIQREQAVEAAADKMRILEETAITVQEQIAQLHAAHQAADDPELKEQELELAHREIESLNSNLTEMTEHSYAQAARIQEMENELPELRRQSLQVGSEPEDAIVQSDIVPGLIDEAVAEIDALRESLINRDMEIERFKREMAQRQHPTETVQTTFAAQDADGNTRSMGEILLDAGIITERQLESALEEQRSAKRRRLGSILVEKGHIREEIVAQVVGSQLNLAFVRLPDQEIEPVTLALMDGRLATHHMCFPISATTEQLTVAMANPLDLIAIEDLEFATNRKIHPVVATLSDITSAIVQHYGVSIANAIAEDNFDSQTPPTPPAKNPASQAVEER